MTLQEEEIAIQTVKAHKNSRHKVTTVVLKSERGLFLQLSEQLSSSCTKSTMCTPAFTLEGNLQRTDYFLELYTRWMFHQGLRAY